MKTKSVVRQKAEGTHEFFPRSLSAKKVRTDTSKPSGAFIFNKAPINKQEAFKEIKSKVMQDKEEKRNQVISGKTASGFLDKLYQDDDEVEELRITGAIDLENNSDIQEARQGMTVQKKRVAKVVEKTSKFQADSKIGKLSLKTNSFGLFAICEITPNYLIVNHTRNTKGYIQISEQSATSQKNGKQQKSSYKIGQLIQAVVVREQGKQNFVSEVSDKKYTQGHKVQLSISLEEVNKGLTGTKVTKNMLLQGRVKSKEEKGYLVDLGFKDKSQGFLKFSDATVNSLEIGQLVQLIVKNVTSSQAIINCQLVAENHIPVFEDCVQQSDQSGEGFQLSSIKPGFLVSGKVTNVYDNGVQVSFLGGVIGTCFTDHLQNPLKSYKSGSKVLGRVISVDPQLKKVAISLKEHIISWTNFSSQLQNFNIGQEFSDVKVDQLTYGNSFILKLKGINAFLHKSQLQEFVKNQPAEQESDSDNQQKKKVWQEPSDLNVGSVLSLVKIKEFNYFDGTPILTARPSLLSSYSINFEGLKVGQFIEKAKIIAVNQAKKYVTLAINDFVKGNLHIEHMSDKPMKTIPPKLSEIGKEIKVRIFELNPSKRFLEFTKKDSFLKEDCPCVFERGIVDVKQGDKFFGVIIARNEFGYILKGFGGVKGLLTFTETEAEMKKSEQSELKVGSLITAYCLFKKKDKGIALTLNKKKAKTLEKVIVPKQKSETLKSQLPNQEQIHQLISKHQHAQLIEQPLVHVGSIRQFKISKKQITEEDDSDDGNSFSFLVFESTDNETDSNNEKVISVVPKQFLPENFSKKNKKQIYEGYILDNMQSNLKEQGCIFISTLKKEHFKVQKPVLEEQTQIKIGEQVKCKVQLIKEYGIIAQIIEPELSIIQTGFMINQQLKSDKKPKVGQDMTLVVLDIDHQKKIADLGERVSSEKEKKQKKFEKQTSYKATVELNKDSYLVLSVPKLNHRIAFCVLPTFGQAKHAMKDAQTGEQMEVRILGESEHGHLEAVPYELPSLFTSKKKSNKLTDLSEGCSLTAEIRGLKGEQAFFHLNTYQPGKGILGRLHMIECDSAQQFLNFKIGQYLKMKILKTVHNMEEGNKRQWLELTMKTDHLKLDDGQLDEEIKKRSTATLTELKEGDVLEGAIVVSQGSQVFNFKSSHPLCVQVSSMLRVQIPFDQIISSEDFLKFGSSVLAHKFKVGQQIPKLYYLGKSKFSLINQKAQTFKKGDLVTARFVSVVAGCRGITVQISSNEDGLCGFIETCEITDELIGDVFRAIEEKNIFCARIIDRDSNGRWQLSARESVTDPKKWAQTLATTATSKEFMDFDAQNQCQANMRNKILKYGPSVALSRGELCLGYVVNIGKSGCFIQIGHNCVVRAGLNELSDQSNFDFITQVPVGRLVVGRITKVEDSKGSNTAQAGNEKRFNFSTRESLIVHGVGAVERSKLKVGDEVNSIVMEVADGKAFCQIKGSYIKIKVKPIVSGQGKNAVQIGDLIVSKLTKVTKEKISSEYQSHVKDSGRERSEDEKISESLLKIVQGETKKAIQQSKVLQTLQNKLRNTNKSGQDFDPEQVIINKPINQEDEIAQQIEDLKQLRKQADSSEDDVEDSDDEMQGLDDDSDEAEMKRIMKMDEEDDEEVEEDDDEGGEDENMEEDSNLQESSAEQDEVSSGHSSLSSSKKVLKKRNLKDRVREEEIIRAKEKRMRSTTDQPKDIDDFERMLQSSSDQSYLWIQYMAFMLDNLGIEAARKVADRAVKAIPMTAEQEKLNVWTALMNLESNFGTQQTLEEATARALEVNDRKKVYLNLIDIMKQAGKEEYVEGIYKQLCKKYGKDSVDLWVMYLEFLIETKNSGKKVEQISDSKPVLARALQSLPKDQHVNLISRVAQTECRTGQVEAGRTMFEGIVSNYPKRFDIWSVYMDMEMKYGQSNQAQARHLFERCLSNDHIRRKPKKMKLVFQKYMEFESKVNNKSNLAKLRQRAEEYINSMAQGESESD